MEDERGCMMEITDRIGLRDHTPEDEELWKLTFFDSVRSNFAMLNLPDADLDRLLSIQYNAQRAGYAVNYPDAANQIIVLDGVDAGRVIWTTELGDLTLIDIAILSEHRGKGIGGAVLNWFLEKGRVAGLPVRLSVAKGNRAIRLYERLGFLTAKDLGSHFQMEWSAG
jgi:ribosomal protein S18 acetylase RimI-like enzyme